MLNRVVGDSLDFFITLWGNDGTVVSNGTGTFSAYDANGSLVADSLTATNSGSGDYTLRVSSTGWAKGPVKERWKFVGGFGTLTENKDNGYRLIGTESLESYINVEELKFYYEQIEDYFDGSEKSIILDAKMEIDARLEAMGHKLPLRVKPNGFYDQPLRDLNAYEAIYRIVSKRQSSLVRDEETPWYEGFRQASGSLFRKIQNKVYSFDRDYSPSEGGVGTGTKTVGTSEGQLDTNWRGGVGNGFQDSSYERDWVVQIHDIATTAEIGSSSFVWSNNNGMSWHGTLDTDLDWLHLGYGVHVRFHRGTYTGGTTALFAVGDQWKFKTFPRGQTVGGKRTAVSY